MRIRGSFQQERLKEARGIDPIMKVLVVINRISYNE
jgi:hypothetical protein